jgi:ABC transport system ATP-binding/permease protein
MSSAGLAEAAPAVPVLVVRTRRDDHTLHGGTVYHVGRDPQADIVIADSRVSWRHGVLRVDGDRWVLEDSGSTNGTFVGPQRVERVMITSDCVVRLGNPDDGPLLRCMPQTAAPAPDVLRDGAARAARHAPADPGPPTPVEPIEPVRPAEPGPRHAATPRHPGEMGGPRPPMPQPAGWQQQPAPQPQPQAWQQPPQPQPPQAPPAPQPRHRQTPQPQAPAGVPASLMPSVDFRPTARMPLPVKALRIGRTPDNDLVLPDLDVSRHHAELRRSASGAYEIVDLGSHNGTFVNGRKVSSAVLSETDIVSIGHSTFRLTGGELRQYVDSGEVTFSAQDLVVTVGGGKVLLDHVTFPIPEKTLLGVIGPSGAGKSTLLGALTGTRPADTGTVLYDNRDLYRDYAELRYRIGLVPQESVLHTQLTARRALQYSAELRFPADTTASERDARVDEVMGELGLTKHANTRADRLSGGQLKRVNVAQELLTRPSLLFLDEPTSGLDPGLDKSVMEQMKDLAHDGRTVIVVTHSVDNLDQCDRLLVLVPGGRIAFYGPPSEGLAYFGQNRWAEVFQQFDRYPDRDWAAEYRASPAYAQYVVQRERPPAAPGDQRAADVPVQRRGGFSQTVTLTKRYIRVISSDRGFLLGTAIAPFLLGALIRLLAGKQGLANLPSGNPNAQTVLILLVICAVLSGTASSIWELVKERAIYKRERSAGLSSGAYLASKLLVLGAISIAQSVVLVLVGLTAVNGPSKGAVGALPPLFEILIAIVALGLASMCVGLLVSALVSTTEKAVPFLVMITLVQVVLSGGLLKLGTGLAQVAWLTPSRWGFSATATTINFNAFRGNQIADPFYNQTAVNWLRDVGALIALAVVYSLITWLKLQSMGPRRRKG